MLQLQPKTNALIVSLLLHFTGLLAIAFIYQGSHVKQSLLVCGVHSKKPTYAYFNFVSQEKISVRSQLAKVRAQRNIVMKQPRKQPAKKMTSIEKKRPSKKTFKAIPKKEKTPPQKAKIVQQKKDKEPTLRAAAEAVNVMDLQDSQIQMYQEYIQDEFARVWSPPIGVPKGVECRVRLAISAKGIVESFRILEKSKMLIFDMSIIRDAKKLTFVHPRYRVLWGKTFESITIRQ